ncbi:MAG: STAS domain-containing protein [Chloroflexia bacterium]|nr:STAS domain-containing protein [Chloroflexia bacterium]
MVWDRWTAPRATAESVARREQLVNILALAAVLAGAIYGLVLIVVTVLGQPAAPLSFVGAGICIGMALFSYYLSRRGRVRAAAYLIVFAAVLIGIYSAYVRGGLSVAAVTLAPGIVFAGIVIGGRAGLLITVLELALYAGITLGQGLGWLDLQIENSPFTAVGLTSVALLIVTLVLWQTMQAQQRYIDQRRERETMLERLAQEKDRLLEELRQREESRRHLLETIQELGSPVIPLAEGVIAMPLVGAVDSGRAQGITQALLQGVTEHRARAVLVDITGVPLVDTAVVGALMRAMAGVQLLGATPVLVGIRAAVAQTIVELGVDMEAIVSRANMQEGLEYALSIVRSRQGSVANRISARTSAGQVEKRSKP